MSKNNKIGAVIFDMDGVLIEAKDWHYEALNRALGLFGYTISRYDHLVTFDGLPTRKKLEMLSREKGLPTGLHNLVNELKQIYTMELVHAQCRPTFSHEYAMANLKARGFRLGVASNSVRRSVETMMRYAMLAPYLDFMLSNEDVNQGKPHPDIYLKAVELAGLPASQCLVVEDNENGIAAAEAAGAKVMVVRDIHDVTLDNIERHLQLFAQEETA
jgi:beta-phosphoglucomutase